MRMKQEQRKKGFRPFEAKQEQFNNFRKPISKYVERNNEPKGQRKPRIIKCWKCGGDHYLHNCPEKKSSDARVYHVKDEDIVGDNSRSTPRICVALDNHQVDHQSLRGTPPVICFPCRRFNNKNIVMNIINFYPGSQQI